MKTGPIYKFRKWEREAKKENSDYISKIVEEED